MNKNLSILDYLRNREVICNYKKDISSYKFKKIKKNKEFNILDNQEISSNNRFILSELIIIEIIVTELYLFVLTITGYCFVFNKYTQKLLFIINDTENNECIKSIYYNKKINQVIVSSLSKSSTYHFLSSYIININKLKSVITIKNEDGLIIIDYENINNKNVRTKMFNIPDISFPGFFEFDYINGMLLVFDGKEEINIYRLSDYNMIFNKIDPKIEDVKLSPERLVISYISEKSIDKSNNFIEKYNFEIKIDNKLIEWNNTSKNEIYFCNIDEYNIIENSKFTIYLPTGNEGNSLEFLELFNSVLFVKYKNKNCILVDISLNKSNKPYQICSLENTKNLLIGSYLFIYETGNFLMFSNKGFITMYTNRGKYLYKFDNHMFNLVNQGISCDLNHNNIISVCINKKKKKYISVHFICMKSFKKIHDIDINEIKNELNQNINLLFYDKYNNSMYICINGKVILYS